MDILVKKSKNRRSLRKNKYVHNENRIRLMGVNAAGISSKLASLNNVLRELSPSIFFIEETKLKQQGRLKLEKTNNFIIYELNRKERNGGGIAIRVREELKPTWIGEGDDNTELLVVEVEMSSLRVRCVGAYGPQENDIIEKKKAFWERLSEEVENADEKDAGFILRMDGNLWAGQGVVNGDPNQRNQNGKLFNEFLAKHPHLHVVNSLELSCYTLYSS